MLWFPTRLKSAQDCEDTDVTMSQMQCWRKEKSCLWDGNRGVGERVSETPWKIQKNLLSIDGPSLSARGWTSQEPEYKEMRFAGWEYYLGEEKSEETEMYNIMWKRFREGCFRRNDRPQLVLGIGSKVTAFTDRVSVDCIYILKITIIDFFTLVSPVRRTGILCCWGYSFGMIICVCILMSVTNTTAQPLHLIRSENRPQTARCPAQPDNSPLHKNTTCSEKKKWQEIQ